MDLALAEAIFDEAASHRPTAVRFTGWGEPLLHPQIGQLAAAAKKRGLPLKIYTNGLALTPQLMDLFVEIGLDDLQFSLQGLNEAQYLFNRTGSNYQRLKDNITMAAKKRKGRDKPFLSLLTSVLEHELRQEDPHKFTENWLKLVDKVAVDLTNLNFVSDLQRVKPFVSKQSKDLRRGLCVDVFLALEIKYDGSIQFCGQDSRGLEEHTIGRFGRISLREAWHGSKMEAQRNSVGRALGHDSKAVCRNCYHNTDKYELFKNLPKASSESSAGDNEFDKAGGSVNIDEPKNPQLSPAVMGEG
jgi:organic radical activating enzyme